MASENVIDKVTLHITDCKGCDERKDNRECTDFLRILSLVKAFRKESEDIGYKFEVVKIDKTPFSIQINKEVKLSGEKKEKPSKLAISVSSIEIDSDTLELRTRNLIRIHAYYTVRYKNGDTRLVIIENKEGIRIE